MLDEVWLALGFGLAAWAAYETEGVSLSRSRCRFFWGVSLFGGYMGLVFLSGILIRDKTVTFSESTSLALSLVTGLLCVLGALIFTRLLRGIAHEIRFLRHEIRRR